MKKLFFLILLLFPVYQSCKWEREPDPVVEEPSVTPPTTDTEPTDVQEFTTQVSGLSGLCYSKDKTSLIAVSDKYGIYELNLDGTTKRKFPYSGTNDLEAICMQKSTSKIYVADESSMSIYRLEADEKSLTNLILVDISGGVSNKGIEGLAEGNDTLYIANQESPTLLIKYALKTNSELVRIPISYAGYLSDIFFDYTDHSLWICDSKLKKIYHCTANGQLIAMQSVNMVSKAEAIVVDRALSIVWIGCDETGKLYRIKLKI